MKLTKSMTASLLIGTALSITQVQAQAQAQHVLVNGTINQLTSPPAPAGGTTIDLYRVILGADGVLEIDMRAAESYNNQLAPPGALVDLNGDGEYTVMDGHMRLFAGSLSGLEVGIADDSSAYSAPGDSDGWADGSVSSRDSYMLQALSAGTYILAVSDYNMTAADAIAGFNTGDTIGLGQNHADYRLTINAFDDLGGNPISLSVSKVPVPAAVWLFGSALMGYGTLSRRKQA